MMTATTGRREQKRPRPLVSSTSPWRASVLMLALLVILAACGGDSGPEPVAERETPRSQVTDARSNATPEATDEAEATPEATEEAEATPEPTRQPRPETSAETDREALIAFYNATGGDSWSDNTNWLSDEPLSEWEGVSTDDNGRVTELRFFNKFLRGEIPPELASLANLERLDLRSNDLSGEIPPELASLASMEYLGLGSNRLSGEIPPELGNITGLEHLGLSSNRLSGEIPPELGNLTSLRSLTLGRNNLTGEIPPELGNITGLLTLNLSKNRLSGEIPPELGNITGLEELHLDENQLSGCVPSSLRDHLIEIPRLGDLAFC